MDTQVAGWHLRDAILVQRLQGRVAVLSRGPLVHVAEALHGGHVALDALFWNVQFGDEGQAATVIVVKEHRAAVMALKQDIGQALGGPLPASQPEQNDHQHSRLPLLQASCSERLC